METNYDNFGSESRDVPFVVGSRPNSTSSSGSATREVNLFISTVRTIDSPFGKLRVPSDLENIEIAFLVLATLSILGTVAMTIYRLVNTIDDSDSTFAILLLVNIAFCLVYVFHGVFGERPYELWAFMAATILVTLYCIIELAVTSNKTTIKVVRLIVVLVFAPIDFVLSFIISKQHYISKNLIIRTIRSAKIGFQNMCADLFIFQTLLKFDFQTGVSLVFLVLTSGVGHATTKEIVTLVVGSFLEIVWLIVGSLLSKYENFMWVYLFLALSLPQPVYAMYKVIKTGINWNEQTKTIRGSIIACACLFMITRCAVYFFLWIVVKNFGKGLRQSIYLPDGENKGKVCDKAVDHGTGTTEQTDAAPDDYLGENVHYDTHN